MKIVSCSKLYQVMKVLPLNEQLSSQNINAHWVETEDLTFSF